MSTGLLEQGAGCLSTDAKKDSVGDCSVVRVLAIQARTEGPVPRTHTWQACVVARL